MNQLLIPQDKANHAIYGALVFAIVLALLHRWHLAHAREIALGAVHLVGAAKEAADYLLNRRAIAAGAPPPHGVEFLDFAATWCGGMFGYLVTVV